MMNWVRKIPKSILNSKKKKKRKGYSWEQFVLGSFGLVIVKCQIYL